jgi:Carboxypeptidase regulatory-like domain
MKRRMMTTKRRKATRKKTSESCQPRPLRLRSAKQHEMIAHPCFCGAAPASMGSQQLQFTSRRFGGILNIRTSFRLALLLALTAFAVSPARARNQDRKGEAALRTIHGSVVDKNENPVPSSVVYLLNVKTQAVKTYIADDAGAYRFSGLDPNVDYEVHAERNDMTSPDRTVSSFDSRHDIEVILKLSRKKSAH